MLTLAEELLLLSLHDTKGHVMGAVSSYIHYGLAGALLAELALQGRILLGEKQRLTLREGPLTGEPLLDEVIEEFRASGRERKAVGWVNRLGRGKLVKRVAGRLVEKGIVRQEQKRFLALIPYTVYPQEDAGLPAQTTKHQIKARLRAVVLGEFWADRPVAEARPDARTVALLSLLQGTRMLPLIFTRDERKAATRKIKELVEGDVFGQAVAEVLAGIDAAVIAVIVSSSSS